MFLMPMAMIIIMALIQDAPFRDYQELKIPLMLVNNDKGELGNAIEKGLNEAHIFSINKKQLSDSAAKQAIKAGDFEIGVVIPADASEKMNTKVSDFVNKKLAESGMGAASATPEAKSTDVPSVDLNINIIFSPQTKTSFKASILASLKQSASKFETQTLLDYFTKALNTDGKEVKKNKPMGDFINFTEVKTVDTPKEALLLNSVQHNVPAWTIFGMFFIVITMSGSIIKERDDGSYTRILTMPGSYITVLAGKITSYFFVCLIQCALMLMVGIYILPHLGLPKLIIGTSIAAIGVTALFTALGATGYGVMVGTLFRTHQQASTFGAVSVVILAALGGIWVPVYVMPEAIRMFAEISPLYWALTAFHKVFLNGASIVAIAPYLLKLLLFFAVTIAVSLGYNASRNK